MTGAPAPARQFAVFVAVGLLTAAVDVGLLQLLTGAGARPVPAATAAFAVAFVLNFALHARVTFGTVWSARAVRRFAAVVLGNYGITIALVAASAALLTSPLPGKLVSLPLVAVNGFLWSKHWVFK